MGLCWFLNAHAQLPKSTEWIATHSTQLPIAPFLGRDANPDADVAHVLPNSEWLHSFSSSLMGQISYPARGKAYQITGTMYVKIGIDSEGKIRAVAFQKSLGKDFEQAIIDALHQLPPSKIKPLALPLVGYLQVVLPVRFSN